MTTKNALPLPPDLYSPDQLTAVMMELRSHITTLRELRAHSRAADSTEFSPSALLLGTLHAAAVPQTDRSKAEALLKELTSLRAEAPIVHLTLAGLPPRTLKRQLTEWLRTNIHPHLLMTFAARSDIGGGLILTAGSHIYDFSFRRELLENKHRIAEIFNHV